MKLSGIAIFYLFIAPAIFAQTSYIADNELKELTNTVDNDSKKSVKKFEFVNYSSQVESNINFEDAGTHFLGSDIAYKFQQLEGLYTLKSPVGPGNPGQRITIQKPEIYNCIYKINKHIKKQIKREEISEEKAKQQMDHYLEVAIAIISQNTEKFESALKNAKSVEEQAEILKNTVLKSL